MNYSFFIPTQITSLLCLGLFFQYAEAVTCIPNPISNVIEWDAFISNYNTFQCSPANIANGSTITLTNNSLPLETTLANTLIIQPNFGTAKIEGDTFSILSTISSNITIEIGSGLQLDNGSLSITQGTLLFNSSENWTGGNSTGITTLHLNEATVRFAGSGTGVNAFGASGGGNGAIVLTGKSEIEIALGKTVEFAGPISGSGSFHKMGSGTLILNANNTYSSETLLLEGILQLANSTALGSSSLTFANGTTLQLVGNLTLANELRLLEVSNMIVSSGSATLLGEISGPGSMIVGGTLVIAGSNTYSGGTTLLPNSGNIKALSSHSLGSGTLTMNNSTTAIFINGVSVANHIRLSGVDNIAVLSGVATLSGGISGSGSLVYVGPGTLVLSGKGRYTGSTDLSSGTIFLQGLGSIEGSSAVSIQNGAILDISETSSGASLSNLSGSVGSTINMGNATLTISVSSNQSSLFQGILSGSSANLIKEGPGNLILSGTNSFAGDSSEIRSGTLTLQNSSGLGGSTITMHTNAVLALGNGIQIGNPFILESSGCSFSAFSGTATISGQISGRGGLVKVGSGTLVLTEKEIYTGPTTIASGFLSINNNGSIDDTSSVTINSGAQLIANANSSVFVHDLQGSGSFNIQNATAYVVSNSSTTFSGPISGTEGLTKKGSATFTLAGTGTYSGDTTVSEGSLYVSGSLGHNDFTTYVECGAWLGGSGTIYGSVFNEGCNTEWGTIGHGSTLTITELVDNFGVIDLGDVASGLNVGTDLMMETDSTLIIFIGSENSLVTVADTLYMADSVTLDLNVHAGFSFGESVVFLMADNIIGKFTYININGTPLIVPDLHYGQNQISIGFSLQDFRTVVNETNALHVGAALKTDFELGNSSVNPILLSLLFLTDDEIEAALNAMQPAPFKGLAISQENNAIKVQETIGVRFESALNEVYCFSMINRPKTDKACNQDKKTFHIWADGFGDILQQKSNSYANSSQVGYQTKTGGFVLGIDGRFANYFYLGALGAYTGSGVEWKESVGSGDIYTGYGGIYFSALSDLFYTNLSVLGGFSHYHAKRNIKYPHVDKTATSSHGGSQILSHIDTGLNIGIGGITLRPFDAFDYISQTENGYTETGAGSFNLRVQKSNEILLRNELGLQFASCFCIQNSKWTISPKLSWVREVRVKGSTYTAAFVDTSSAFTVTGYFPDRSLISPGFQITGLAWQGLLATTFYYNGEFASKYNDHTFGGELRFGF